MAKTYHEAYPNAAIRIFDSASSIGGVWAKERLYPGLKTNNKIGSYEFSDFPMEPSNYGLENDQHIPGPAVHQYLCNAAEHFGILAYVRLRTKVESASRNGDRSWTISFHSSQSNIESSETQQITANKLVIATGLTSEPFVPYVKGQELFEGTILHSRQLKDHADDLAAAQNVVVVGGNKSAWDVCYSVARAGRKAHMVLRPSGGGPSWVWPLRLEPLNTSLSALSSTRFFTIFDPWPFDDHPVSKRLRQFLHGWTIGRWITMRFWNILGAFIRRQNGYGQSFNTQKLTPWYSVYWMGNSLGVHNYTESWFDLARQGNVNVHIGNIDSLSENTVNLSNGSIDNVDVLACCTGWKAEPPIKFMPAEVLNTMGIPGSPPLSPELSGRARQYVLQERRLLEAGPARQSVEKLETPDNSTKSGQLGPYRLYRYVVPAHSEFMVDRNIAFLGMHLSVHAIMVAQVQALWITAFFEDKIPHLQSGNIRQDEIELDTARHVEYQKLRRPRGAGGHGAGFPDLVFDSVPYIDSLMDDLGLNRRRKTGILAEIFKPYRLVDYRDLVQEWRRNLFAL